MKIINRLFGIVMVSLLMFVFISTGNAQSGPSGCTNPTVVDGYMHYIDGSTVGAGVNITVSVSGPSSCNSFSVLTDANGYYAVAGLDINGNSVSVSGNVSGFSATNSSTASSNTLKLDLIPVPGSPSLSAVSDRHNSTDIVFSWTSGSVPDSAATEDRWFFDSTSDSSAVSPKTTSGSSGFTSYTWKVMTCYVGTSFCSSNSTDTFEVSNTAPSAPSQTDQTNTHATSVNLTWTSGTDSDTLPTDSIVDEFYFDDDSNPLDAPLQKNLSLATGTHTFNISSLTLGTTYYWLVRTCDDTGASNNCTSSSDSFSVTNTAPSVPVLQFLNKTNNASQYLYWTSGTDPEGDPSHDEFQLSYKSDFSVLLTDDTSATSPATASLSAFNIYYWRVRSCDDSSECSSYNSSIFQKYTCGEDESVACTSVVSSSGGGSSGGGGAPKFAPADVTIGTDFDLSVSGIDAQISSDTLTVTISPGQEVTRNLRIENKGTAFTVVTLDVKGLTTGLSLSNTRVELDPQESKEVKLAINIPEDMKLGAHTATVVASADGIKDEVDVILEVVSSVALFDTELVLPDQYKALKSPTPTANFYFPVKKFKLVPQINLVDIGAVGAAEVEVLYEVRDLENNLIYSESETVQVDGRESFTKEIELPRTVKVGEYVLSTSVTYQGATSVSSERFEITETNYLSLFSKYWIFVILAGIAGLVAAHMSHTKKQMRKHAVYKEQKDLSKQEGM